MENSNNLENSKNQKKDDLHRITINREGERALTAIVECVNDGFIGGKVNRTQIANWVLMKFNENLNDADINQIRGEYFDEIAVLEAIVLKAKENGQVPSILKSLLQEQFYPNNEQKKRMTKKSLTKNVINDDM